MYLYFLGVASPSFQAPSLQPPGRLLFVCPSSAAPPSYRFPARRVMWKAWTSRRSLPPSLCPASRFFSTAELVSVADSSASKWVVLPAVPPPKGIARLLEPKDLTALKWVARCCPEISHNNIEKLFRTRQVRQCHPSPNALDTGSSTLKRISRKDIVAEGSVLYLPRFVLRSMEAKESLNNEMAESKKRTSTYKPSRDDVEWAQELILHMDEHIIAINKPAGLAVQGGVGVGRSLDDLIGPAYSFENDEIPKLVHRLDKETSGILILGRTQESTAILHEMFRSKTSAAIHQGSLEDITENLIKRKYWALVIGAPSKPEGRIVAPLKKIVLDGGKSETIVISKNNGAEDVQEAITEYRVMGPSVRGCTWLELQLYTGRKHQLRVHCAQALGTPILGDYKYGRKVHDDWLARVDDDEKNSEKKAPVTASSKRRSASFTDVKGSITSEKPFLHLHSRLIAIPKIKQLSKKKPMNAKGEESKEKLSFVDNLRLFAPLPPHMKASWNLQPPTKAEKDLSVKSRKDAPTKQ